MQQRALSFRLYLVAFIGLHVPLTGLVIHALINGLSEAAPVLSIAFISTVISLAGTWTAIFLILRSADQSREEGLSGRRVES